MISRSVKGIGLAVVLAYVLYHHPPGWGFVGYFEDMGGLESARVLLSDTLGAGGGPSFHTDRWMAPFGTSMAFFSWAMERDWLGAWAFRLAPGFPFLWAYFALSILGTYLGVGWILERAGLPDPQRWVLALAVAILNPARHFATFYHLEHVPQHWLVLGLFLDAWILAQAGRARRISPTLEAARLLLLQLSFGLAPYYWGLALVQWTLVRASLLWQWRRGRLRWESGGSKRVAGLAALAAALLLVQLRWFIPLVAEIRSQGSFSSPGSWPASWGKLLRPVALDFWMNALGFRSPWRPFWDGTETVVTVGWAWLGAVAALGVSAWKSRRAGWGWRSGAPLAGFFLVLILFSLDGAFNHAVRAGVPGMGFFRVACRSMLIAVPTLGALAAVWWISQKRLPWRRLWAALLLMELAAMSFPTTRLPALDASARGLLGRVRAMPGDGVLSLPFCVIGGNGVCAERRCPFYPASTLSLSLTAWHGKKVPGAYFGRMTQDQCGQYAVEPYDAWFAAWREDRCFSRSELDALCSETREHPGRWAAVLVFPDLWKAAARPSCRHAIEERLGAPIAEAELAAEVSRTPESAADTRVWAYRASCGSLPESP